MNNRIAVYISLFVLVTATSSCSKNIHPTSSVEYLSGTYETNISPFGLSSTKIDFKKNGMCYYEESRHMQEIFRLKGEYLISNNNLYIRLLVPEDTTREVTENNLSVWTIIDEYNTHELKEENNIRYHLKYLIENDKLYVYRVDNGKLVREATTYSDERGRHKVPYYLEKKSSPNLKYVN